MATTTIGSNELSINQRIFAVSRSGGLHGGAGGEAALRVWRGNAEHEAGHEHTSPGH